MIDEKTKSELTKIAGSRVKFDEPLSRHTWMGIGGPADAFVEVHDEDELGRLVRLCRRDAIPILPLGGGANLIVRDGGWRGVAVRLDGDRFMQIEISGVRVLAGARVTLTALIAETVRRSLSGLEHLAGIPGTVGGAVRMNAGARGVAFGDLVEAARVMDIGGNTRRVERCELGFSYRRCSAAMDGIVLDAELKLAEGERAEIERRFKHFQGARASALPSEPSAGCVFRNPPSGRPAGELIERLGLKGMRSGGAVVSERHANVIVNEGGATARDVLSLMEIIRKRALESRGVDLESEVVVVGE
jgi:UDP-N-acetylenolpyruvoylglucosamine reductase